MNMERLNNTTIAIDDNGGELIELWPNIIDCIAKEDPMKVDQNQTNSPLVSTMPTILKPTQNLPLRLRGRSESISHHHNNAQVDELLEDWPRRMSCCSINTQDRKNLSNQLQPNVSFSERSTLYAYVPDPGYDTNKAYTKKECKSFGSEAMSEAIRIKRLILSTPGATTKDSFKSLLKDNTVSLEEVVGIEHLVFNGSVAKLSKERQDHTRAILLEHRSCHAAKMHDDPMKEVRVLSASRSVKSVKEARIRAAIAA